MMTEEHICGNLLTINDYSDSDQILMRYIENTKVILDSPVTHGYFYTQLMVVETEENKLLTYRRDPKIPLEKIWAVNGRYK